MSIRKICKTISSNQDKRLQVANYTTTYMQHDSIWMPLSTTMTKSTRKLKWQEMPLYRLGLSLHRQRPPATLTRDASGMQKVLHANLDDLGSTTKRLARKSRQFQHERAPHGPYGSPPDDDTASPQSCTCMEITGRKEKYRNTIRIRQLA